MDDSAAFSRGSSPLNTSSVLTADTEDFIVGDRVWVNGNKPGYIQFIGETKFARGEWAGIVLDHYEGKNDGSIHGIRYFQCEPNRGIFARLYRLSRFPLDRYGQRLPDSGIIKRARSVTPDRGFRTTTRYSSNQPSYTLPSRPSKVITKMTTTTTSVDNYDHDLKIGDKAVVHSRELGMQSGRVRYVGPTSFASGLWVGVELDEPYGKNDGSVAGKSFSFNSLPILSIICLAECVNSIREYLPISLHNTWFRNTNNESDSMYLSLLQTLLTDHLLPNEF